MDKLRAAAVQALEAIGDCSPNKALVKAAYALREALDHSGEANEMVEFFSKEMKNKISVARAEQAEQEPVLWQSTILPTSVSLVGINNDEWRPLYIAPVRTKDLTDDEILKCDERSHGNTEWTKKKAFARAVIAADRRKNK